MQKQMIILGITFLLVLAIMGVASAADNPRSIGKSLDPKDIGTKVTNDAMSSKSGLKMSTSDRNLLITTASTAKIKGKSTEDSVQAVVTKTSALSKYGQRITYGQGNLLTINRPDGTLEFIFVSQKGTTLMANKYIVSQTGTITATQAYNIGTGQSEAAFKKAITALGSNGYNIAAIANLWAQGAPADLLATTYSTGTINSRIMTNYAVIKQFQQNYPLSGKKTNYIFSRAGNFDDESALSGEYGFSYELYTMNSGDPNKMAIMQYDLTSKSGLIALMKYKDLKGAFGTVVGGALSEIKFNNWIYNDYLKANHLNQLYSVTMLKQIDETAYKYLWFDPNQRHGHGLAEAYINKLPNQAGTFDQSKSVIPVTDIDKMKEIGKQAFTLAKTDAAYLTYLGFTGTLAEMQAAFMADLKNGKIGAIATPYYMNFQGMSLVGLLDGINYANDFNIHTLMTDTHPSNHGESLGILFFRVVSVDLANSANTVIKKLMVTVTPDGAGGFTYSPGNKGPGYINTMPMMFAHKVPWDMMRVFYRVGCPRCLQEDLDAALYGRGLHSLKPGEQYILASIPIANLKTSEENWCKNAAVRMGLFGVSPSLGTYLSLGGPVTSTENPSQYAEYILIIWNSNTHTGTAMLILYDLAKANELMAAEGYTNSLNWHLDKVYKDSSYLNSMFSVLWEMPLISDSLDALTAPGEDPVAYMQNYDPPSVSTNTHTGLYNRPQTVTITAEPGSTIYYTLDGTTPTSKSIVYTVPISVEKSATLKYIATKKRYFSGIHKETITIDRVAPVVNTNIPAGTYNQAQRITLTTETKTTIHYTKDGTTPTTHSKIYTQPIHLATTTTLKYIAVDEAGNISPVTTLLYTINPANPTEPVTPTPGTTENGFTAITGTITNTWNGITSQINTNTANNQIAPGLPLEQNTQTTEESPVNTASKSTGLPIGTILAAIFLAIIGLLAYIRRETIFAAINRHERPGK